MIDKRAPAQPTPQQEGRLDRMPEADFVAAWKCLVGERPATMLDSRSEMIHILVESTPVAGATDGEPGML